MIILDTDVCIEILRGNKNVFEKRKTVSEKIAISFMTVGELFYGAEKSKYKSKNITLVDEFILSIDVINTDLPILKRFGKIKAVLKEKNILLPDADVLIAATAITNNAKLITGNTKHFNRFENLIIENWIR